jgi:hypothetical protein
MCCVPVYSNATDPEAREMVAVFGAAIAAALAPKAPATARPA